MANECQNLLLISLTNYYNKHPNNREKLIEIISTSQSSKNNVSLRVLDWFVTHYAKNKQIIYWIDDISDTVYFEYPESANNNSLRRFNLYHEYRAQLQAYTKMYFDPFRRKNKF